MTLRGTLRTTERLLRQLRHDRRTIGLVLLAPSLLLTVVYFMFEQQPLVFDRVALVMLGVFPFILMFLLTSVAMLRERTSGTLERLLTTPVGRLDLLRHAMQDYIHQVWRAPLVPGLSDILEEAHRFGALGAALSGAGPTVLCFHDTRESTTGLHDYLHGVMKKNGLEGRVMDFPIDTAGTVVTRHS